MPVPDYEVLQQYAPLRNRGSPSRLHQSWKMNQGSAEMLSLKYEETIQTFWGFTFLQEIRLSKIVARVHADLYPKSTRRPSNEVNSHFADDLSAGLDMWFDWYIRLEMDFGKLLQYIDNLETRTASSEIFAQFEPTQAQQVILMRVAYLSFLYHHYTVIIHGVALHNQSKCLEAARQALSLLQEISPGSESVYNGISWCIESQP